MKSCAFIHIAVWIFLFFDFAARALKTDRTSQKSDPWLPVHECSRGEGTRELFAESPQQPNVWDMKKNLFPVALVAPTLTSKLRSTRPDGASRVSHKIDNNQGGLLGKRSWKYPHRDVDFLSLSHFRHSRPARIMASFNDLM